MAYYKFILSGFVFFNHNRNETQTDFSIPSPQTSIDFSSPPPPENISYYLMDHVQLFDNNYSIHINWNIEDFVGIELLRADLPDLIYNIESALPINEKKEDIQNNN